MNNLGSVFVLAAVLEMIFAPPPDNMPKLCQSSDLFSEPTPDCCQLPPLVTMKNMFKCGFPEPDSVFARKRPTSRDCPKFKCLAKKYNTMREGEMDPELINAFMDKYALKHPTLNSAVAAAKKKCVGKQLIGMESCPPEKIFACLITVLLYECPGWQTDPRCDYMKDYVKICSPYLFKF